MQQNNFQGVRINEVQDGNANDVCKNVLIVEEIPPTLAKRIYSFQKRKCPILDKHLAKKVHT